MASCPGFKKHEWLWFWRGRELHARETAPPRAEAGQLGEQRGGVGQETREAWLCKLFGAPRTLARVVLETVGPAPTCCYARTCRFLAAELLLLHTYFSVEHSVDHLTEQCIERSPCFIGLSGFSGRACSILAERPTNESTSHSSVPAVRGAADHLVRAVVS